MADTKISGATDATTLNATDKIAIARSGSTTKYYVTGTEIATFAQVSPQVYLTRVVVASGAITVTTADYIVIVNKTVGAASAVAFPAGVTGQEFIIKDGKGDAAANNITVTPAAGTIDGAATSVISTNYGSATYVYNGTSWNVI